MKYEYVKDEFGYTIKVPIKKPKTGLSESEIQAQIAKVFIADGWEVIRYNCGNIGDTFYQANTNVNSGMTSGHPDLKCEKNDRVIRIEVKTLTGKLSLNQKKYSENAAKYGNTIHVLRSKNDAVKLIKHIHLTENQNIF